MNGSAWRLRATAALAPLLVVGTGCPAPPLPPPEEILKALSYAILQPQTSCAELRDEFGLLDLPLVSNPGEVGIDYEQHLVVAPDGQALRLWYMPAPADRGWVIVSAGNTGPMECYLFTARILTGLGWSVVMYDYEGFGGSGGEPDLQTLRPSLETVLDWTLEQSGAKQVSLFGMSLGSIPTIAVASDRPEQVNAVILDSPVALAQEIERFGFLVRGRSKEILAVLDPWMVTEVAIAGMHQPMLVFIHEQDVVTPPGQVVLLLQRAPGPTRLVLFTGLGHAAGQFLRTVQYSANLNEFLTSVWEE